jgi:HEAT repeat protein
LKIGRILYRKPDIKDSAPAGQSSLISRNLDLRCRIRPISHFRGFSLSVARGEPLGNFSSLPAPCFRCIDPLFSKIAFLKMDAPNRNPALPPDEDLTEVRKPASLLIAQFFLFPLIIIGICVGIFLFFGYLTYEQRSPTQFLDDIRSGTGTQRWQAAFELSNMVKSNPKSVRTPEFIERLMAAYESSPDEDIRVRGYLARILGELKEPKAVPLLVKGLEREEKLKTKNWGENNTFQLWRPSLAEISNDLVQSQIYTLFALGSIGDNSAVPGVVEQVKNQDPSVRNIAAYVSGVLGDQRAVEALRPLLNDTKEDVRYNAALALAQLGDNEGSELLLKLLDRAHVDSLTNFTPDQRTELMVNAVRALARLGHPQACAVFRTLSQNDPAPAVQSASLEALKKC